jgi:hypothetical protein
MHELNKKSQTTENDQNHQHCLKYHQVISTTQHAFLQTTDHHFIWLVLILNFDQRFFSSFKVETNVMDSMLASAVVYRGFKLRSGQAKDYAICMCCFSAKYAALSRKSKDWLARNRDKVSEWGDMSICGLLFQWANTIKAQLSVLV